MPSDYLIIVSPQGRKRVDLPQGKPLTIGRHPENGLIVTDDMASRYHCVIELSEGTWSLRDLESRNGTKVNGNPVKQALLVPGDVISIGKTAMKLYSGDRSTAPAAAKRTRAVTTTEDYEDEEFEEESAEFAGDKPAERSPLRRGAASDNLEVGDDEFEQTLRKLADSLPDRSFSDDDVTLINRRGNVAHAAKRDQKKSEAAGEVVDSLKVLLLICSRLKATDIHIEPKNDVWLVRIRVDGTMVDVVRLTKPVGIKLCALVKVLSDIDIQYKNIIQEGHFSSKVPGRRIDYRVSFAPSVYGQKLVVRVLDTATTPMQIWDLQLPEWMTREIEAAGKAEAGMILVCGPTGSGKTTSLYASLRSIDTGQRNVVTIEDPVEIQLDGVTQIPVDDEHGNSFGALLRSVLRQDPDAIMVGEIRDPETVRIAMQAAITGHLVFSTVHARDTISTIFRILDLGVEPYMVSQGLHLVLAQRLVRLLCTFCKKARKPTDEDLQRLGPAGENLKAVYEPGGCTRCLGTGYAGRRAVFELLSTNGALREAILNKPTLTSIKEAMKGTKFMTLQESAHVMVAKGMTSLDEVERAVGG